MSDRLKLRKFWKPDGRHVDPANEQWIKAWMRAHGLSERPGALSLFLHSPAHTSTRKAAVAALTSNGGSKS